MKSGIDHGRGNKSTTGFSYLKNDPRSGGKTRRDSLNKGSSDFPRPVLDSPQTGAVNFTLPLFIIITSYQTLTNFFPRGVSFVRGTSISPVVQCVYDDRTSGRLT